MPRSGSSDTLARQWEMLQILYASQPKRLTPQDLQLELAKLGYPVDVNTVRRNLELLSSVFPITADESKKPHEWFWMPGAKEPLGGMGLAEALSLVLLESVLVPLLPSGITGSMEGRFKQARDKLRLLKHNEHAPWRDLVRYVPSGLPFPPPLLADGVLETVQDGLLRRRRLRVAYRATGKESADERILDPLSLIQLGERSYLVAGYGDHETPVAYALHRIEEIEVLDDEVEGWDGFSLDEYLMKGSAQFGAGEPIHFRARIHERLRLHFEESAISDDQELTEENGQWFVSATVRDTWQLEFWILSWSFYLEVLEPVELREKIRSRLKDALNGYGGG